MARISMENVAHRYSDTANPGAIQPYALKPLNLHWQDGGAYALLGPSGCGKTTLLNLLSGLLVPSEGRILFDDIDVTTLTPQARNIAQVFQFPVIYDTMTVSENLEFPLRNRKVPKQERDHRVAEIAELLGITHLQHARARNLSADEKQKVSLGRGLVRTDTNAILFDEPLTVVDPALKWELRAQLKKIHQNLGQTMVYVTHDQTEALTFADKVVVMLDGQVLQTGTPQSLFEQPEHTFVGTFIGSPGMNVLPCKVAGARAQLGEISLHLRHDYGVLDDAIEIGIRPEHVKLVSKGSHALAQPAVVQKVSDIGREKIVQFSLGDSLGGHYLRAILPEGEPVPNEAAALFDADYLHVYQHSRRVPPGREATSQ